MPKKPTGLIYGVDDKPPPVTVLLLGLQHIYVMSSGWILVAVVVTAIGGSEEQAANVIRMSMIASGLGTILQSLANSPVGSGYLCPLSSGPAYIAASVSAGRVGGLPLIFGLTLASGLFEGLLSRVMGRLRPLFPPEVTGLVVTMVGIELVTLGCPRFLGFTETKGALNGASTAVAVITLLAMIGPTVWGKGKLRLYPLLIGLGAGYISAYALDVLKIERLGAFLSAPLVSLPQRAAAGLSFNLAVLPAFLVAALASTLKGVGDLTLCQKINDADWRRTDMKSVSGGIAAGGICTGLSGLFGGMGQSTFSSNVGFSLATGATSRSIALGIGALIILLAFFPKLAAVFVTIPEPVMGAIVVYVACYMIIAGVQVMTSRMLDSRRTFVIGIALIFGLSVDMVPGLYRNVPVMLEPMFASALAVSTILVVLLNLLFRIGVTRRHVLELTGEAESSDVIFDFMETHGSAWGARRDVIQRAAAALNEFAETAAALELARAKIEVQVSFDEFNLDVDIRYDGRPMEFPALRPTEAALLEDKTALAGLSGFLIRQYADRIKTENENGRCRVHLHFDH